MIEKYFRKDIIFLNVSFETKKDALKYISQKLVRANYAKDAQKIYQLSLDREKQFSTAIGSKVAMPHIKTSAMNQSIIAYAKVTPLDWEASDQESIEHIFFIALNDKDDVHIEIIQQLSANLLDKDFLQKLNRIKTKDDLIQLFKKSKVKKISQKTKKDGYYDIVAIAACPTGIAHTYLAKDSLVKKAKELNLSIKVETQGTEGASNVLTKSQIDNARGIIFAIDRSIDTGRFANHPNIVETSTKKAIKTPQDLIKKIIDKKGAKLSSSHVSSDGGIQQQDWSFNKFGNRLYKGIFNGVAHMLPFVIFGGIMIAIAFMIDTFTGNATVQVGRNFGSTNDVAKWFSRIGGLTFGFLIVPILSAYIAYGIVGKIGLLPAFVTGLISTGQMGILTKADPAKEILAQGWLGAPIGATSGFFGAIIGAILVVVMIILFMKYINPKIPKSLNGITQILLVPFVGTLIIATMFFFINFPILYLNLGFTKFLELLADNTALLVLLGIVLGIMMASDFGGPINKAAYVFATTTLATAAGQGTIIMASVMAAGMTPPLGVALSTSIFRKKLWSKSEVDTSAANYIMGFSFITEGAIPFAAKNPKVIIPASMIGSALAGGLVAALQIKLAAPHGGIFVLALVKTNLFTDSGLSIGLGIVFYLLAIIAGAVATMLMILVLRKFTDKKEPDSKVNFLQSKPVPENTNSRF